VQPRRGRSDRAGLTGEHGLVALVIVDVHIRF